MKMRFVSIVGARTGYSPDQCGETFTVGELIDYLNKFDKDLPVYLNNDSGYTYGEIDAFSIDIEDYDDGEDEEDEDEDEDEDDSDSEED